MLTALTGRELNNNNKYSERNNDKNTNNYNNIKVTNGNQSLIMMGDEKGSPNAPLRITTKLASNNPNHIVPHAHGNHHQQQQHLLQNHHHHQLQQQQHQQQNNIPVIPPIHNTIIKGRWKIVSDKI